MKIFGDAIDDKIFPKKIKRFTQEEKNLIDKFINSILREDKKSELEESEIKSFNDRPDGITEEIYKQFIFKGIPFMLRFKKFYAGDKNLLYYARYGLNELIADGNIRPDTGHLSWGAKNEGADFDKDIKNEKVITGIIVDSWHEYLLFYPSKIQKQETEDKFQLVMRTKYEGVKKGGFYLTAKCKKRIEMIHFKRIKKAILIRAKFPSR